MFFAIYITLSQIEELMCAVLLCFGAFARQIKCHLDFMIFSRYNLT